MLYTETRLEGKARIMMPWQMPFDKPNNKILSEPNFLNTTQNSMVLSPPRIPGFSHFTFAILLEAGARWYVIKEGGEEKLPSL